MRRIRIKQVPDDKPNADGVWVERDVPNRTLFYGGGQNIWGQLTKFCEPGHHAVQYERVS